jgi:hypothetical protein
LRRRPRPELGCGAKERRRRCTKSKRYSKLGSRNLKCFMKGKDIDPGILCELTMFCRKPLSDVVNKPSFNTDLHTFASL